MAIQVKLQGVEGDLDAPKISDVLGEGHLAVDVHTGRDFDPPILIDEPVVKGLKTSMVLAAPPVHQIAVAVELRPLRVEAVGDLVADDEANGPEVGRRVCL